MDTDEAVGASFRDPSGFVFRRSGQLFRQVNVRYAGHFAMLESSGLYSDLTEAGLLIRHEPSDEPPPIPAIAAAVIRPETVPFLSYPYEWCFGQLKAAALATLTIQLRALGRGMSLKDASAFNIQFVGGRPTLIDTLSFEPYVVGHPWVAYRQFCEHFLAPLMLISQVDAWLGRLPRLTVDGIPLDTASRLLPMRSWVLPAALLHVHLHSRSIRRFGDRAVPGRVAAKGFSKKSMTNLIEGLRHTIEKLDWSVDDTEWSDYETEHGYSDEDLEAKCETVRRFLSQVRPRVVWDLGANTGLFSRLALECDASVVSIDVDPGAVEKNFRRMEEEGETRIHPLWIDLRNPSPALGWAGRERESLVERSNADLVLALALVHHLAIGGNVPFLRIAEWFSKLAADLIVEFVPKEDPQTQRLLASREDVFEDYHREAFESAFSEYYDLKGCEELGASRRIIYHYRLSGSEPEH